MSDKNNPTYKETEAKLSKRLALAMRRIEINKEEIKNSEKFTTNLKSRLALLEEDSHALKRNIMDLYNITFSDDR